MQCVRVGEAVKVTISHRTKPIGLKFPPQIEEKPLLTKINGSEVRQVPRIFLHFFRL